MPETTTDRPMRYAPLYLDGGGDPDYEQIDAFLRTHFNARAVRLEDADSFIATVVAAIPRESWDGSPLLLNYEAKVHIAKAVMAALQGNELCGVQYEFPDPSDPCVCHRSKDHAETTHKCKCGAEWRVQDQAPDYVQYLPKDDAEADLRAGKR